MSIEKVLKAARKSKNISQEWLAEELKISQSFLSKIENNPNKMTIGMLKRYVSALGIDMTDVLCSEKKNNIVFQLSNKNQANGVVFNSKEPKEEKNITEKLNQIKEEMVQLKNVVLKSIQKN